MKIYTDGSNQAKTGRAGFGVVVFNDDNKLLSMISQQMKRGGKQSKDRFIFVINKCDELDPEKGESIDDLLNEVKKYLNNYNKKIYKL